MDEIKLRAIWSKVIDEYKKGTICSERHLQSLMFHMIRTLKDDKEKVFIEPNILEYKDNERCYNALNNKVPDIIIVDDEGARVTHFIELKYDPLGKPEYNYDLNKFKSISELESGISIPLKTDIKSGNWDYNDQYEFTNSTTKVYAFIANQKSNLFTSSKLNEELFEGINNIIVLWGMVGLNEKFISGSKIF